MRLAFEVEIRRTDGKKITSKAFLAEQVRLAIEDIGSVWNDEESVEFEIEFARTM